MVSEETALWSRNFDGQTTPEMIDTLESNRARFRELWIQHEKIRQDMTDAGFMPPVATDDFFMSPMEDPLRRKIEGRLRAELEGARAAYCGVSQEFRLFAAQGTGLPGPDGSLRARQIASLHSAALRKYTSAIRRLSAFLTDGKMPEE